MLVNQEALVNILADTNVKFAEWGVVVVILVGALVFTLAWWKIADRWADSEHKRFGRGKSAEPVERVVIKKSTTGSSESPDA